MPLSMAKPGETNYIVRITGKDEVRQHLSELGFAVGERVMVISAINGTMILQVKDCRIALGGEMANRILIETDRRNFA
ncbi:hypothetical protein SDC9_83745 [bioreactor metagenome]|uniref:Ferrous iron transporter FeoA-like domain-containing protein n=1 Tax=bioreactor metagenome TaxID=1076179 RepID=A0A644Z908_9ZZZZ|nr:FeoA family protein [Christensenella sp.]